MSHRTATRSFVIALALVAVASFGACSSTSEQVSEKIAKEAQKELKLPELPETTCPKGAEAKKGEKFDCTLEIESSVLTIKIDFTDDTHFTFTPQGQVFDKVEIQKALITQAKAGGVELKSLACHGASYVVISVGKTTDCKATDNAGKTGTMTVGLDAKKNPVIKDLQPDA